MTWRLYMSISKVFVITHKECEVPKVEGQYILLVGAKNKAKTIQCDFCDDTGKNISDKNKNYCVQWGADFLTAIRICYGERVLWTFILPMSCLSTFEADSFCFHCCYKCLSHGCNLE